MKQYNNRRVLLIIALALSVMGCNRDTDFINQVYITQAVSSQIVPVHVEEGKGSINISASAALAVGANEQVNIEALDASYLERYNSTNHTSYSLLSDSAFKFSAGNMNISSGTALSNTIEVKIDINKWKSHRPGRLYAIPVRIKQVGNGIKPIPGQDFALLTLESIIKQQSAQFTLSNKNYVEGFEVDPKTFTNPETNAFYENFTVEGRFMCAGVFDGNEAGYMWQNVLFAYQGAYFHFNSSGSLQPTSGPVDALIPLLSINRWYHFALVHKSGTLTYYIDGKPLLTSAYTAAVGGADFGHTSGTAKLTLAEYRIWRTARSTSQIRSFMCAADPTDPDLIAYWPLNTTDPKLIVKDISGHGNDLKIISPFNILPVEGKCPGE